MGCGANQKQSPESKAVEKQIKEDAKTYNSTIKLLLLGAGESGKSTFAKQIRIIHLGGFTDEERAHFKEVIFENVLYAIKSIIAAAEQHELTLSENNQKRAAKLMEGQTLAVDKSVADAIKGVYKDKAIQKVLTEKYNTFHLIDSAQYFLDNIDRLTQANYTPSVDDLLRCRAKTTGIQELHLQVDRHRFIIVDVGGQRSERKKWIHCFEDVTAVLFFVSMSEYDLTLYEDDETNRMHESLKLFDEICNSKWFASIPIVLFLNKKDLFAEKIKKVNITTAFPDYDGDQDYKEASEYIQDQFIALNENPTKTIYPHITQATDTNNIRVVFDAVRATVVDRAVQSFGL